MFLEGLKPDAESVVRLLHTMVHDMASVPDDFIAYGIGRAKHWLPIWEDPWRAFWADGGVRNRQQYLLDGVHLREHLHKLKSAPLIIWARTR